jgi:hypothetical protein
VSAGLKRMPNPGTNKNGLRGRAQPAPGPRSTWIALCAARESSLQVLSFLSHVFTQYRDPPPEQSLSEFPSAMPDAGREARTSVSRENLEGASWEEERVQPSYPILHQSRRVNLGNLEADPLATAAQVLNCLHHRSHLVWLTQDPPGGYMVRMPVGVVSSQVLEPCPDLFGRYINVDRIRESSH